MEELTEKVELILEQVAAQTLPAAKGSRYTDGKSVLAKFRDGRELQVDLTADMLLGVGEDDKDKLAEQLRSQGFDVEAVEVPRPPQASHALQWSDAISQAFGRAWLSRVDVSDFCEMVCKCGERLLNLRRYKLAYQEVFYRYCDRAVQLRAEIGRNVLGEPPSRKISVYSRYCLGASTALFLQTVHRDDGRRPDTVDILKDVLRDILQSVQLMCSQTEAVREELYWCLYNSSLLTMRIARWLRLHGFAELCIQPLWLMVESMHSCLPLMAVYMIPFRARVTMELAYCAESAKQLSEAVRVCEVAQEQIEKAQKLETMLRAPSSSRDDEGLRGRGMLCADDKSGVSANDLAVNFEASGASPKEAMEAEAVVIDVGHGIHIASDSLAERIRSIFDRFDKDGGGTLDRYELHRVFKVLVPSLTPLQINTSFKHLDKGGDGVVSREEFCQWILTDTGEAKKVMRALVKATSDALATSVREVFARFDQDGDGKLDRSELWRVFKTLDGELRIPEIASLSQELDTGGDGMVSHKEFLSWLRQGSDRAHALTRTIVKETGKAREARIQQAFTKYDSTKDGQLNIEELANALKVLGSFSSDEIRHVRDDLDKSKDGKVSYEEFRTWIHSGKGKEGRKEVLKAKAILAPSDGDGLEAVFYNFCGPGQADLSGTNFHRLCKDCHILDDRLDNASVDLIFSDIRVKDHAARSIDFLQFEIALELLAERKGVSRHSLRSAVLLQGHPESHNKSQTHEEPLADAQKKRRSSFSGLDPAGVSAVLEKKKPTRCSSQKRVASLLKLHETPGKESWRRDVDNSKLWKVFGLHTPAGRNLKKLYEAPFALPPPCSRDFASITTRIAWVGMFFLVYAGFLAGKRHEHSWFRSSADPMRSMTGKHGERKMCSWAGTGELVLPHHGPSKTGLVQQLRPFEEVHLLRFKLLKAKYEYWLGKVPDANQLSVRIKEYSPDMPVLVSSLVESLQFLHGLPQYFGAEDCKSAMLDGMPAEEVRQGEAETEIEYTRYTNMEVQAKQTNLLAALVDLIRPLAEKAETATEELEAHTVQRLKWEAEAERRARTDEPKVDENGEELPPEPRPSRPDEDKLEGWGFSKGSKMHDLEEVLPLASHVWLSEQSLRQEMRGNDGAKGAFEFLERALALRLRYRHFLRPPLVDVDVLVSSEPEPEKVRLPELYELLSGDINQFSPQNQPGATADVDESGSLTRKRGKHVYIMGQRFDAWESWTAEYPVPIRRLCDLRVAFMPNAPAENRAAPAHAIGIHEPRLGQINGKVVEPWMGTPYKCAGAGDSSGFEVFEDSEEIRQGMLKQLTKDGLITHRVLEVPVDAHQGNSGKLLTPYIFFSVYDERNVWSADGKACKIEATAPTLDDATLLPEAPPQRPQTTVAPEAGVHVAVRELRNVLRKGRDGGFGAWAELAASLDMEDRTSLAELLAVTAVVPPTSPPTDEERRVYMGRLFPQRATTEGTPVLVKAAPRPPPTTSATPGHGSMTPSSTGPRTSPMASTTPPPPTGPGSSSAATILQQSVGAPPTAWAHQVSWQPPQPTAARDDDQVSGTVFLDAPTTSATRTAAAFLDPTEAREPETTASPTITGFPGLAAMEAQSAMPSGTATPAYYIDAAGHRVRAPPEGARRPVDATGIQTPASTVGGGGAEEVINIAASLLRQVGPRQDDDAHSTAGSQTSAARGRSTQRGGRPTMDPPPPPPVVDAPPSRSSFPPLSAASTPWQSTPPSPRASTTRAPTPPAVAAERPDWMFPPGARPADDPAGSSMDAGPSTTTRTTTPTGARSRSKTAAGFREHLSDERIRQIEINMTDDYRQHKRAMHRRGARAVDDPPKSVKHLLRRTLNDVIAEENLDKQGIDGHKPKPPPTSAPTYCAYWFCSTLPANTRGARIPWQSQEAGRRVLGWCSHPCTSPQCPHFEDLYDVDSPGLGRCLRPVVEGNGLSFHDASGCPCHPAPAIGTPVMNQQVASSGPSATVADFFRDVASAGGSAYIATLARFGAINTPAVRDSFAVLLENGVPEGLLLQILAPVPPTQPEPTAARPPRHDVPNRRTIPRASLTAALEAMDPGRRQDTLAAIDWHRRPAGPWSREGQFPLFPLDANKLHTIAGAMRIAGYRSTGLYLDAVVWHQENTLHTPVTPGLRRVVKTLTKAAARGLPGSRLKQAFDLDELSKLVDDTAPFGPFNAGLVAHAVDVVIVATWFMLREVELAAARVRDLGVTLSTVSLDIPLHKTAQGGQADLTRRTFRCVCTSTAHPLCPRCAAHRHLRRVQASAAATPADFLFPTRPTVQRSKAESAEMFRLVLDAAGFETVYLDEQGKRRLIFGGHAARVAGATFMAMRGVPVAVIQLLGRWASTAVERYVQQAPLAVAAGVPAQALAAPSSSTTTPAQPLATPTPPALMDLLPTGNAAGHADTAVPAPQQMVPNVDFAAEVPGVEFVPEPARMPVADAIGDSAPRYVMNCRTKMVHTPGVDEASTERSDWQAKCGWPYGVRQFFRLSELPPDPALCRKCFPTETVDVEAPEAIDSSSSSSSSTSGATSDSD
ncbi:CML12 [Symbiodinium sp. CCMP2592]|nr:CML12 [Symbiodinium sp. CCMP2592]